MAIKYAVKVAQDRREKAGILAGVAIGFAVGFAAGLLLFCDARCVWIASSHGSAHGAAVAAPRHRHHPYLPRGDPILQL